MTFNMKAFLGILLAFQLFSGLAQAQGLCSRVFEVKPGFNSEESWSRQIVSNELDSLNNFFKSTKDLTDDQKINLVMSQDLRKSFFKIESISRMLMPRREKFFEKQRLLFKEFEGTIGQHDLAISLRETAEKIQEPKLVAYFSRQEAETKTKLLNLLNDNGLWAAPEPMKEIKKSFLKKGRWLEGKKEKKFLVKSLQDYAKFLQSTIKDGVYDNADIELGYHKIRRSLRWVLMQGNTLNGLIEMSPEPRLSPSIEAWYKEFEVKNPDILKTKFMKTAEPLVSKPIAIPQREYAIINELVIKIGDTKDVAEMQIYFGEALNNLGVSAAKQAAVKAKLNELFEAEEIDHQALARELQERLSDTKLIKSYINNLEEMN